MFGNRDLLLVPHENNPEKKYTKSNQYARDLAHILVYYTKNGRTYDLF
jgi:hypothetical protein